MIKVGLTGNIGSGKSTIARVFEIINIPVFYADDVGKNLLSDVDVEKEIRNYFGEGVFDRQGIVNRKELARIVFNDTKQLHTLNSIIHPRVRQEYFCWLKKNDSRAYTIHEAAILFESGFYEMLDSIIFVSAPEDLRIQRIMQRDHADREAVEDRIRNQQPEKDKIRQADYVIINDGKQMIIPQVLLIDRKIRQKKA